VETGIQVELLGLAEKADMAELTQIIVPLNRM
jgi:hypothetical protein